ncbi:MAG: hypothetical protein C4319_03965 [Acidimicrobiia bacterium]
MQIRRTPVLLLACMLGIVGCSRQEKLSGSASTNSQLTVAVSAFPVEWLVRNVGGDRVRTIQLLAPSSDIHDAELNPAAVAQLGETDLVILVGSGVQPAVEEALSARQFPNERILRIADFLAESHVVVGSSGMSPTEPPGKTRPPILHSSLSAGQVHFWLDPLAQVSAAEYISKSLSAASPENADYFKERFETAKSSLDSLNTAFSLTLHSCRSRKLVVYHSAFKALANRYGLEEVPVTGSDPEVEPKPSQVSAAIEAARNSGAKAVFSDPESGRAIMEQVARESGTVVEILDPIEVPDPDRDYDSRMRSNLQKIANALGCQESARVK